MVEKRGLWIAWLRIAVGEGFEGLVDPDRVGQVFRASGIFRIWEASTEGMSLP